MKYEPSNIYCVDAYEAIKEIPDKSIDLIYTDVPYDQEGNGGSGCLGEKKRDYHAEYEKVSKNTQASRVYKSTAKYIDGIKEISFGIDYSILDEFVRVLKKINLYIWCSKRQIPPLLDYFVLQPQSSGGRKPCRFEILTWHKTNPIPTCNGKYLSDTEYCLLFREEGAPKIGGTMATKGKYYISSLNVADKSRYGHSTIKPLEFVSNHILNSTSEGDLVLDTFCGSGTTCVACKNLNRRYIGFEINERWAKVAQGRLNNQLANGQMTLFTM